MKKKEMIPGQKYRGYGVLNEFGEFEFIPEDTGSRKDKVKYLKQGDGYSVTYTANNLLIHMKIKRKDKTIRDMLGEFVLKFNNIFDTIKNHEF